MAKAGAGKHRRPAERRAERFVNCSLVTGFGAAEVDGTREVALENVNAYARPRRPIADPAPPLLAAPDAAADTELEGQEHAARARRRPWRDDDSLAEVHDADAGLARGIGGGLPGADDVCEEAAAERRLLGEDLVTAVAVDAGAAGARRARRAAGRARRRFCASRSVVGRRAIRGSRACARRSSAGRGSRRSGSRSRRRPVRRAAVELAGRGIPADLVGPGGLAPDEPQHLVTARCAARGRAPSR